MQYAKRYALYPADGRKEIWIGDTGALLVANGRKEVIRFDEIFPLLQAAVREGGTFVSFTDDTLEDLDPDFDPYDRSLDSSLVKHASYFPPNQHLRLVLESGRCYDYYEVPEQVYCDLVRSSSPGSFYNRIIKDRYACIEVEDECHSTETRAITTRMDWSPNSMTLYQKRYGQQSRLACLPQEETDGKD